MVRSTLHSNRRAWFSAAGPASARLPDTRGAAKGNTRVGVNAGLVTFTSLPTVTFCSVPIHSTRESTSRKEDMLAGTSHSFAWAEALLA